MQKNFMQRTKKSIINAIVSLFGIIINSVFALILTRLILLNYGSDFNGVVATANQIVNMLLIVEGGFTLATNVALFQPYMNSQYSIINSILSASRIIFNKIGILFLILGTLFGCIYSFLIKSELSSWNLIAIFMMIVISCAFNLIFTTKCRILYATAQKEYIIAALGILTNTLQYALNIYLILMKYDMLVIRFVFMTFSIINGILIFVVFKKQFPLANFKSEPSFNKIKGTRDVVIQKTTTVIYSSIPLIFLSTFVGTLFSSVYSVYNSVFVLVKTMIYAFVNAPVNGFGQLIVEKEKSIVYDRFLTYEFIVLFLLSIILSVATVLINPFVRIYTSGVQDINYVNMKISIMFVIITLLEVIHIPSGVIINMSGNFRTAKNFQIIACLILVVLETIGALTIGIYGIMVGIIITNITLCIMEIYYTHILFFGKNLWDFLRYFCTNFIFCILIVIIEKAAVPAINNYFEFFFCLTILLLANTVAISILNYILHKTQMIETVKLLTKLLT